MITWERIILEENEKDKNQIFENTAQSDSPISEIDVHVSIIELPPDMPEIESIELINSRSPSPDMEVEEENQIVEIKHSDYGMTVYKPGGKAPGIQTFFKPLQDIKEEPSKEELEKLKEEMAKLNTNKK